MSEPHNHVSAGSEVQLPLSTDMVLTAAKEVQKHLNEVSKPYSAGIVGDCIVEIERLRDQLSFAEFEWRRATDGMKERDATIAFLSGAPAQSMGMREALERIAIVCTQHMDRDCNHRMALDGVRQIANDCLDTGLPTANDVRGILASQPSPAATVETKDLAIEVARNRIAELVNERDAALARCSAGTGGAVAELKEALRLTRRALKEEMDHITETLEAVSGVEPQALAMQKALEEIQKIGGPMVSRIARDALASQPSAATAETRCDNCRIILKPNEGAPLCERCRENYPALARCSAGSEQLETYDAWLAPETFHSLPMRERVHYTVKMLGSVNLTKEACDRQARRITDALEAAGLIPSEPQSSSVPQEEDCGCIGAVIGQHERSCPLSRPHSRTGEA